MDLIDRGQLAKDLLANTVYQEAFDGIKKELYAQWQNSENPQEREYLHIAHKMMDKLQTSFKIAVTQGEVEIKVLDHKRTLANRLGLK
jgi:hypothetical protein